MSNLSPAQFGYHGTAANLRKGDIIEPGRGGQVWSGQSSDSHAYYESPVVPDDVSPEEYGNPRRMARNMASGWAASAVDKAGGGTPNVYFVKAHGDHEGDPNVGGGAARRAPRLEVVRRAPFNSAWDAD